MRNVTNVTNTNGRLNSKSSVLTITEIIISLGSSHGTHLLQSMTNGYRAKLLATCLLLITQAMAIYSEVKSTINY